MPVLVGMMMIQLMSVLKKIKASKAPGLDKISGKLLKAAGYYIIESLMYLFNLVLNTGIFPDDMKLAKVTPIYKSRERTNCGNYRPISIISVVAKILEKIIYNQPGYQAFVQQSGTHYDV